MPTPKPAKPLKLHDVQRMTRVGSWEWDIAEDRIVWSKEVYEIFEVEPESFVLSYESYRDRIHPADLPALETEIRRAFTHKSYSIDHRILPPGGAVKWVSAVGEALFDDAGRPTHLRGTVQDITDRKQAEQALRHTIDALAGLNRVAALRDIDLCAQLRQALDLGLSYLDLEIGLVGQIEGERYTIVSHIAPPDMGLRDGLCLDLEQTSCRLVWHLGDLVTITDIGHSPYAEHPSYEQFGLECYIGTPLEVAGQPFGTLSFHRRAVRETPFTDSELLFMRLLARWVGATIERDRTEAALRKSRERLALSQTFANIGTWDWDFEAGEIYWSAEVGPMFGRPAGEATVPFDTFHSAIHPDDQGLVTAAIDAFLAGTGPNVIEHRVVWPDGTVRWLMERGDVVRDETGTPVRMLGIVQDITRTKLAEERLRLFQRVIETSDESVGIASPDGVMVYVNPAMARLFATPQDTLVGRHASTLLTEDSQGDLRALLPGLTRDGSWQGLLTAVDAGGRIFPLRCAANAVRDEQGRPTHLFNIMSDYSAELRRQEELQAARDLAVRANRAKSDFLATISHDLRTPLNGVLGFANLLRNTDLSDEQDSYVDTIRSSGQALMALIDDLLDLAKLESGQIRFARDPVDLPGLAESVRRMLSAMASERGLELRTRIGPGVPPLVRGDELRLRQILANLAGNALKFTERGWIEIAVTLAAPAGADGRVTLCLSVSDSGVGIAAADQDRLFERFAQGDSGRKAGGVGLGLAICRQLAQAMGGAIGVESQPGEGSRFWVELPFEVLSGGAPRGTESRLKPARTDPSGRRRILIAEDDPASQALAREVVRAMGHDPIVVGDGEAAVAAAKDGDIALVLMDVDMPRLSGLEAARAIRTLPGTAATVPIVAITAKAQQEDAVACTAAGMNRHFAKPLDVEALVAAIAELLDGAPVA